MKVELVQATPNPLKLLTDIASICYGKEEAKHPEKLLKFLFESHHHSVLEHVYYTFKIKGISRACLGQLTRHRHASYTVRSQRYCDESKRKHIASEDMLNNEEARFLCEEHLRDTHNLYNELIKLGVKKEDARMILPIGISTDLYMSCNLRALIHVYNMRNDKSAQQEIRDLVNEMTCLVVENSPELTFMFKGE